MNTLDIEVQTVKQSDGAFAYHDMAMHKTPSLAIAGRMLKALHNTLQQELKRECERGDTKATDLLDASTTVAANILAELVQWTAMATRMPRPTTMIADEFDRQARAMFVALTATAEECRKLAKRGRGA